MAKIITRFPPSPTGFLHIGNARTALFNYLFAKNQGGEMVLRIEDTDKERSKPEYEKDILDGLNWLGIKHDNAQVLRQSERVEIYKKYLQKLIDSGAAYISKENSSVNSGQEKERREEVIRFKNPNKKVNFNDLIRGSVTFDTSDLGDFVVARSLEEPVYHLTVVVDDNEMGITHVIRGEDHISNTPRQILILEALGFERPKYAHIPLILAPDRSKLGSRHGAVSVSDYQKDYLPGAMVNYLALLGWNPGNEKEIFNMDELVNEFSLEKVVKGGAIFNIEKLDWVNKKHLEKLSNDEFMEIAMDYFSNEIRNLPNFISILLLVRERINKISDIEKLSNDGEFDFYIKEPEYEALKLVWKDENKEDAIKNLKKVVSILEKLENFSYDDVKKVVQPLADEIGRGAILHPMRFALSGKDRSPDPFTIAGILGKEQTIIRLNKAIKSLHSNS